MVLKYLQFRQNGSFSWEPDRLIWDLPPKDVEICCWLQVYKYFSSIDEQIRQEFTFKYKYLHGASKHLHGIRNELKKSSNGVLHGNISFIGVHIRGTGG